MLPSVIFLGDAKFEGIRVLSGLVENFGQNFDESISYTLDNNLNEDLYRKYRTKDHARL